VQTSGYTDAFQETGDRKTGRSGPQMTMFRSSNFPVTRQALRRAASHNNRVRAGHRADRNTNILECIFHLETFGGGKSSRLIPPKTGAIFLT